MESTSSPETISVIQEQVEKQPFQERTAQRFFTRWCSIKDSILPMYVDREEWTQRKDAGILQKHGESEKALLYIPKDLKLWEMVDVMEAVDNDTFSDRPEEFGKRREGIRELGNMFINTGIYIAQNLNEVRQGRDKAIATAQDFYRYGISLQTSSYDERIPVEEITGNSLSSDQINEIDHCFGVDRLDRYKHTKAIKEGSYDPEDVNVRNHSRHELLRQYFKAEDEAENGSIPYQRAVKNVRERYLGEPLHRPSYELDSAILARGIKKVAEELGKEGWHNEKLIENFRKNLGIDLEGQSKTLSEILEIPRLRAELESWDFKDFAESFTL